MESTFLFEKKTTSLFLNNVSPTGTLVLMKSAQYSNTTQHGEEEGGVLFLTFITTGSRSVTGNANYSWLLLGWKYKDWLCCFKKDHSVVYRRVEGHKPGKAGLG